MKPGRVIIITIKGSHPGTPQKVLPGAQPTEQWVKKPHRPHIGSMSGSVPNAFGKTLDPFPVAELGLTCWDSQWGDLRELQRANGALGFNLQKCSSSTNSQEGLHRHIKGFR